MFDAPQKVRVGGIRLKDDRSALQLAVIDNYVDRVSSQQRLLLTTAHSSGQSFGGFFFLGFETVHVVDNVAMGCGQVLWNFLHVAVFFAEILDQVADRKVGNLAVKIIQAAFGPLLQVADLAHCFRHLALEKLLAALEILACALVELLIGFWREHLSIEHRSDAQAHSRFE